MTNLKKVEYGIIGFLVAIIVINFFNKPLNDFVNIIPSTEIRIITKICIFTLLIATCIFLPMGMATEDQNTNTGY